MSTQDKYQNVFYLEIAKISAGQTSTPLIRCAGMQLRALYLPSNFTTSNISLNASPDGTNLFSLKGLDGVTFSITGATYGCIPMLPYLIDACPYLQLVAGTQTSDVLIGFGLMPLYQGIHS